MAKQNKKEILKSRIASFLTEVREAAKGVLKLAFLSANGIGAYVLWFSSDSLTLKIVALGLAVETTVQALAMATKQ